MQGDRLITNMALEPYRTTVLVANTPQNGYFLNSVQSPGLTSTEVNDKTAGSASEYLYSCTC